MTKLELQNKIANLEKNISKTKNPATLAIIEKNLKDAKEKLAALEQGSPAPAPSGGSSELEKLYAQRELFKKGLNSSNPVVQKSAKASLPKVEARIAELEGAAPKPATPPARPAERKPRMESRQPEEVPATKTPTIPSPAKRGRPAKSKTPAPAPSRRGRPAKSKTPAPAPTRRGRPAKMETPAPAPARRGRPAKMETPAPATKIKRGRPRKQEGAEVRQVSINSLTKMADSIVDFCLENGLGEPSVQDIFDIIKVVDKNKVLSRKFAKGGKISRSGKYLSKWQIQQILTDGGMKIGSDEILSGVWLKKKDSGVAQMRLGGGVGYFVISDDILDSGKSVMFGTRRISAKNPKFQGVFEGKMVGGVMKVYDYDDAMWKAVNPNEWQQAYAEGGGVESKSGFDGMFKMYYYKNNPEEISLRVVFAEDYADAFTQLPKNVNLVKIEKLPKEEGIDDDENGTYKMYYYKNNPEKISLRVVFAEDYADALNQLPKNANLEKIEKLPKKQVIDDFDDEGGSIDIYDGDNVVYSAKNLLLAKVWLIKNWKKYDELLVMGSTGDSIGITKNDTLKEMLSLFSHSNYAEGGGVGDTFSMSKMTMDNGELIEMVIAENVSVAEFEKLFSDKGYEKRFDVSLVGFHFAKPNGDTIQLIPSFHKRGEIIRYAEGGEVGFTEQFTQVEDFGYESFYIRKWGKVETNKKEVELLVVASIRDLEEFISEDEMPEEGSFQLDITLIPFEKHISKKHKTRANDESNAISNNTLVNVVNYMGGLNYNPQEQFIFKTFDEAENYLMSKELNDKISAEAIVSGFFMDRPYNRVGQTNWEMLEYIVGERQQFAKGGGVGNFTLADYKENEETNNHSENALMLTKMYGTQDEIFEVERLIKKGEREGGFSMVDYRRIYEITNKYYKHLVEASKRK